METEKPVEWELVEPNVWKPVDPEDNLLGVLIVKKTDVGVNKSNAYYLENKSGQYLVWGSTVLDDRMSLISIGEKIRITYLGTKPNKRGQDTKIFKVERERKTKEDKKQDGAFGGGDVWLK